MKNEAEMNHDNDPGKDRLVQFACPKCSSHVLGQHIWLYGIRQVVGIAPDGQIRYGFHDIYTSESEGFSCWECGHELEPDVQMDAELCIRRHSGETGMLKFTCPDCGGNELKMVKQGHTKSYRVGAVFQDVILDRITVAIDESDPTETEGKEFYRCGNCDFAIVVEAGAPIESEWALIRWLETHE